MGIYHVITSTHDSRTSQRMIDHKVRLRRYNGTKPTPQPIWIDPEGSMVITETVAEIVKEDQLAVVAYNICGDHMHLLLICEENELSRIMQKIKSVTAKVYNKHTAKNHAPLTMTAQQTAKNHAPLTGKKPHKPLLGQKFGKKAVKDKVAFWNTVH